MPTAHALIAGRTPGQKPGQTVAWQLEVIDDVDLANREVLTKRAFRLTPRLHPEATAALAEAGAVRIDGAGRSWRLSGPYDRLNPAVDVLAEWPVFPQEMMEDGKARSEVLRGSWRDMSRRRVVQQLDLPIRNRLAPKVTSKLQYSFLRDFHGVGWVVKLGAESITARLLTSRFDDTALLPPNVWGPSAPKTLRFPRLTGIELVEVLQSNHLDVVEPVGYDGLATQLLWHLRRSVVALPAVSAPAHMDLIGSPLSLSPIDEASPHGAQTVARKETAVANLAEVRQRLMPWTELWVHPALEDIRALTEAEPVDDDRLLPYQREIVGRRVAATRGFLNLSGTGLGKNVTELVAYQRIAEALRAGGKGPLRALMVVPADLRLQNAEEARTWAPGLRVLELRSRNDKTLRQLTEALESDDDLVVLTSPSLLSGIDDLDEDEEWEPSVSAQLVQTHWHQLTLDEAVGLRAGGRSKTSRALDVLRDRADVAAVLNGTPIEKTIDDLAPMLRFVLNDRRLFSKGQRLSDRFDVTTEGGRAALLSALGPLLARYDRSEVEGELPEITSKVEVLEPTMAHRQLLAASEGDLRELTVHIADYLELLEARDQLASEEAQRLREQLAQVQWQARFGVQVLRQAASDPVNVAESTSEAAERLRLSGLLEPALAETPAKRRWAVDKARELASRGQRTVIFTEFRHGAEQLAEALEQAGLGVARAFAVSGRRRETAIAQFARNTADVLIASKGVERGHNLQMATAVIHYDLPWTATGVAQRTGRIDRLGGGDEIEVYFPILSGTAEETVAERVVTRAVEALQALDVSRGVDAGDTELGALLAGFADGKSEHGQQLELLLAG